MPEALPYFFLTLSIVVSYLLVQMVIAKIGRRRNSPRRERPIAEYLRQRVAQKNH